MSAKINFNNPRRGKQPRAAFWIRWPRILRRKRVAYARTGAAHALKVAQMELARMYALAHRYDVPIDNTGPMPVLPTLPGKAWVDHKQDMGELKPPVKSAPTSAPVTA